MIGTKTFNPHKTVERQYRNSEKKSEEKNKKKKYKVRKSEKKIKHQKGKNFQIQLITWVSFSYKIFYLILNNNTKKAFN